ncbi:MAG: hypothetical protein AAGH70_11190 [Pseudomonadota bacterium]
MGLKTIQAYEAETHARQRADAQDRALRLHPDDVMRWTQVMQAVAPVVHKGGRPCDYGPWQGALDEYGRVPHWIGTVKLVKGAVGTQLMEMAWDVAQPAWPEPRRDLIDFALTFLEADVMLFRSGYCKKNLLRRLRQAPLVSEDHGRLNVLIRRAVREGTGLEEFRAYARLAARLIIDRHLPDLDTWLETQAEGALVTGWEAMKLDTSGLSVEERFDTYIHRRPAHFRYPGLSEVKAQPKTDEVSMQKRNALKMISQIRSSQRAQGVLP